MRFNRIDALVEDCRQHLDKTHSRNTAIESYLVGFLLAAIYSDFEQRLRAIVCKRAERTNDPHVLSFCTSAAKWSLRSIGIGDIKGALGQFSVDCKAAFHDKIVKTAAHAAYDNIVLNRHHVAHVEGTNMTFAELEHALPDALSIFDEAAQALGLTPDEIASL